MTPSVHAVLLNWNGFDDTVACINSLKSSTMPFTRIIVIDQASPDGSGAKLEQLYCRDEQIVMIRNEMNGGFSQGVNIGIRLAITSGADMVFLINNDAIVAEDCLQKLSTVFSTDPLAAASGPVIMYYSNPKRVWTGGGFFSKLKMGVIVPSKGKLLGEIDQLTNSVSFLTGCALLIRRETLEMVGLFDPSYFFYGEDIDFGLRIRNAGLRLYFVPSARVWHKIDDIATDRTSPFVLYHLAMSTVILFRKRFSVAQRWYGILLQFALYTPFRFWQIMRGNRRLDSVVAWLKGLLHGVIVKLDA